MIFFLQVVVQVIRELLSVEFDIAAVTDIDQELASPQTISEMPQGQVDWLVVGTAVLGIPVAEADQGVDIEGGGLIFPSSDGEEGANYVSVDSQELEGIGPVDCSHVYKAGLGQVVPVFLSQPVVHEFVDGVGRAFSGFGQLVAGEFGLIGRLVTVLLGKSGYDKQQEKCELDCFHSLNQQVALKSQTINKESADTQLFWQRPVGLAVDKAGERQEKGCVFTGLLVFQRQVLFFCGRS